MLHASSAELFARNVKLLLRQRGIKVKDLAAQVGISPSYLSSVLNSLKGNLSDSYKDAIAEALGVSVADLYREEPPGSDLPPALIDLSLAAMPRARQLRTLDDFITRCVADPVHSEAEFYYAFGLMPEERAEAVAAFLAAVLERRFQRARDSAELPPAAEVTTLTFTEILRSFATGDELRLITGYIGLFGERCPLGDLARLAEVEPAVASQAVEHYLARGVVRVHERPEGRHGYFATREWARSASSLLRPSEARTAHRRFVEYWRGTHADDPQHLPLLAEEYVRAGQPDLSVELLLRAADDRAGKLHRNDALLFLEEAASILRYLDQRKMLATVYLRMAGLHLDAGEPEPAAADATLAAEEFTAAGDEAGASASRVVRGRALLRLERPREAIALLRAGKGASKPLPAATAALIVLGDAYLALEDLPTARTHYEAAIQQVGRDEDHQALAEAWGGLGRAALLAARARDAEVSLRQAIMHLESGSYPVYIAAELYAALGAALVDQGRLDEALDLLHRAHTAALEAGDLKAQARSATELARGYLEAQDRPAAEKHCEFALRTLKHTSDPVQMARAMQVRGRLLALDGRLEGAAGHFRQAITIFQRFNRHLYQAQALRDLAGALETQGDYARARRLAERARYILEEVTAGEA